MAPPGLEQESMWVCPVCGHEVDQTNPVGARTRIRTRPTSSAHREREAFARRAEGILEVAARRGASHSAGIRTASTDQHGSTGGKN
jgi:hypothetical protein